MGVVPDTPGHNDTGMREESRGFFLSDGGPSDAGNSLILSHWVVVSASKSKTTELSGQAIINFKPTGTGSKSRSVAAVNRPWRPLVSTVQFPFSQNTPK